MLPSPDRIEYEATIEDPKVFTSPWKIVFAINRRPKKDMSNGKIRVPRVSATWRRCYWGTGAKRKPAEQASTSIAERDRSKMAETVGDSLTG